MHVHDFNRPFRMAAGTLIALAMILLPNWQQTTIARSTAATHTAATKVVTYKNPINPTLPGGAGKDTNCADPAVIHSNTGKDHNWYLYCTSGPYNDNDQTTHYIPTFRSADLVHWKFVNDAQATLPSYAVANAGLWAPDPHFLNGKYYLYFTASDTVDKGAGIGVMTSKTAHGPWTYAPHYVVEPHDAPCCKGAHAWTFDSSLVNDGGQLYVFYGSFFGGIQARKLSSDGFTSDPATQTQITIDNQYEASFVFKHAGYWYLFTSAANCCNGPLTGYSEFVGRSQNVLGPYVDQSNQQMLAARSGGNVVISQNGNQWIGNGGASIFNDAAGKTWVIYHGIDQTKPYLGAGTSTNKRQLLLEPITWVNGWPQANGGNWTSTAAQRAPAAQKGQKDGAGPVLFVNQEPGTAVANLSDEFKGPTLGSQWSWIHQDPSITPTFGADGLTMPIQHLDVQPGGTQAALLTEPTPSGDYIVETKLSSDVPAKDCCFNFAQPAIFIYKDDTDYVRVGITPAFGTRFIEFGKEMVPLQSGYPNYGNMQIGPPGDFTWIRIAKTGSGSTELYRAYYSLNGSTWFAGGVWTHQLGAGAKIAIAGIADNDKTQSFHATFGYVHVSSIK